MRIIGKELIVKSNVDHLMTYHVGPLAEMGKMEWVTNCDLDWVIQSTSPNETKFPPYSLSYFFF